MLCQVTVDFNNVLIQNVQTRWGTSAGQDKVKITRPQLCRCDQESRYASCANTHWRNFRLFSDIVVLLLLFLYHEGFLNPSDVVAGFATLKRVSLMGNHVQVFYFYSTKKYVLWSHELNIWLTKWQNQTLALTESVLPYTTSPVRGKPSWGQGSRECKWDKQSKFLTNMSCSHLLIWSN